MRTVNATIGVSHIHVLITVGDVFSTYVNV